jgi:hypothetical protein
MPRSMRAVLVLLAFPSAALAQGPVLLPPDLGQAAIDDVLPVVLRQWAGDHPTSELCLALTDGFGTLRDPSATLIERAALPARTSLRPQSQCPHPGTATRSFLTATTVIVRGSYARVTLDEDCGTLCGEEIVYGVRHEAAGWDVRSSEISRQESSQSMRPAVFLAHGWGQPLAVLRREVPRLQAAGAGQWCVEEGESRSCFHFTADRMDRAETGMTLHEDLLVTFRRAFGEPSSVETRVTRVEYRWERPEFAVLVTQFADANSDRHVGTWTESVRWSPPAVNGQPGSAPRGPL